jgi:glycosyltransferase involved in cell wall biosynthesis
MTPSLLLDLSHTSHTRARTGVQRVVRSIREALGESALSVCYDPYARRWRELQDWERDNLSPDVESAGKRKARWPWSARLRGRVQRLSGHQPGLSMTHATLSRGVLVPEIFSPGVAAALPTLFSATSGPKIALFHDAIALKYPELTPAKTVTRFPSYLRELLVFDGIAAVSEDSRQSLLDYWAWLGEASHPPVRTISLGIDVPPKSPADPTSSGTSAPVILSVGSIEGRKNHVSLLEACERLWAAGAKFELRLIGLAHPQTGRAALDRITALQAAGRPLRYDGPVDDRVLEEAYASCAFTVYPSLIEGFGLPVLESLARGRPCICSARGALGESARGGGCLALATMDAGNLAMAIQSLLNSPAQREALAQVARSRQFKTWATYASELSAWMETVPVRV